MQCVDSELINLIDIINVAGQQRRYIIMNVFDFHENPRNISLAFSTYGHLLEEVQFLTKRKDFKIVNKGRLVEDLSQPIDEETLIYFMAEIKDKTEEFMTDSTFTLNKTKILLITTYSRDNHNTAPRKTQSIQKVMVLGRHENQFELIRFNKPLQINYGSGPTVPSIFAIIDTINMKIMPVYTGICSNKEELNIHLKRNLYDRTVDNFHGRWEYSLVNQNDCVCCYNNEHRKANIYLGCACMDMNVCDICVKKISSCPRCSQPIEDTVILIPQ